MENIKQHLLEIRNELYKDIPVGEMDAWSLLQRIKSHIDKLDKIINSIEPLKIVEGQVAICIETFSMYKDTEEPIIVFTKDKEYVARKNGMVWDDTGEEHWIDDDEDEKFLSKYFVIKE